MSAVMSMPLQTPVPPAIELTAAGGEAAPQQFSLPTMGLPQLTRNPQLPQHPLGAYTDSLYEAQVAQLRQQIASQYNDVLQQLGYTDENGNFVPGTAEIEANKQKSQLARSSGLAVEQDTQSHQREGTLFSGLRGMSQARAEFPFQSALADLNVSVPKQLTDLYGQAGDLVNQFTTQHNLLLAQAAQRAAANLQNNAAAGGVNISGAAGGSTPAPDPSIYGPNTPGQPQTGSGMIGAGYTPITPFAEVNSGAGITMPHLTGPGVDTVYRPLPPRGGSAVAV